MLNNSSSSVLRALQLPELLASIGSYLQPPVLLKCVQVSQGWNQTLIPFLWRKIDDRLYAWPRVFKAFDSTIQHEDGSKDEDWVRGIYTKYGHHIRDLHADWAITIFSAQGARTCVNLQTLSCSCGRYNTFSQETLALAEQIQSANWSISSLSPMFDGAIAPLSGPRTPSECHAWVFTQRFWLLAMQNPSLTGMQLGSDFHRHCLALEGGTIRTILMSLPNLSRLDGDFGSKGFDFEEVLESIPQVQHISGAFYPYHIRIFDRSFRQIRAVHCLASVELSGLFLMLKHLPNLDQLFVQSIINTGMYTGKSKDLLDMSTSRLRGLYIYWQSNNAGEDLHWALSELVLPWLPCLTELGSKVLKPRTAVVIATYCSLFQSFQSLYDNLCNNSTAGIGLHDVNAIGELLRRCPQLKTLSAAGHTIEAAYILAEPWVCR
ncbi:hypothetical protein BGZ47_005889 [Haplosporangium gracile]|nr:hypothetical protein BGZ47_005889 [Haplosporangium gracile]